MTRTIAAALLSMLLVLGHAQAGEKRGMTGKPPYTNAYEGLLPAGMTPSPAAEFHPAQLRGARVALVTSANFNEWARVWERWYDESGEKFKAFDKQRERFEGFKNNSNPRNFSEQVIQALQPHVGEIFIAGDLPQARDAGADYYLIIDGWLGDSFNWVTGSAWQRANGGVHLLDGDLGLLFEVQGEEKAKIKSGLMGLDYIGPTEVAMAEALSGMSRQVTDGMREHLVGSR